MDVFVQKLAKDVELPCYAKPDDAGLDLRSAEDLILKPNERRLVSTGIAIAIPSGFVGLIWDRSSVAHAHGVTCLGGVIDAGYRGEIKIVMINLGNADFSIQKNDRVAQLLIQPIVRGNLKIVETLSDTDRASGGFGSTGKQ
ncbi:MAG: dUTP diphosphatase [Candidatus Diapherotrites archaeon]|nr:dUTP diphosphatase [Candidatus Diapherotrites archaeon]